MATSENRKQVAVRLHPLTFEQLQRACFLLHKTQSQTVEDALREYFTNHHLQAAYQVVVSKDCVVLLKTGEGDPEVVETHIRNGLPPAAIKEKYAVRLNMPVQLVVLEGDKP
jgi:hypothetical protein